MSIKCSHNVLEYSETRLSDRLIMLALADRADTDGYCWPSITDIANRTKCQYETVLRRIKEIEKTGELYINRREGSTHQYFVLVGMTTQEVYDSLHKRAGLSHGEITEWIITTSGADVTPDEKSDLIIGWGSSGIFIVSSGVDVTPPLTSHSDEPSLTTKILNHQEPSESLVKTWEAVKRQLSSDMDRATYLKYIEPTEFKSFKNGFYTISAPSDVSLWVADRMTSTITSLLAGMLDETVSLVVEQDQS